MNYKELLAQAAELERQIAAAREIEAAAALAEIKAKIAEFGFTVKEALVHGGYAVRNAPLAPRTMLYEPYSGRISGVRRPACS